MIESLFLLMMAFSTVLLVVGAFRGDEILVFAAGVLFIMLGSFTYLSGVQTHTGWNITQTQVDSNTTEIVKEKTFTTFKSSSGLDFAREGLSLMLILLGCYLSFYAFLVGRNESSIFSR